MDSPKTRNLLLGAAAAALLGLAARGLTTPDLGAVAAQPAPQHRDLVRELAASWTSFAADLPDGMAGTDWATPGAAAVALQAEADAEALKASAPRPAPPPRPVEAATAAPPPPPRPSLDGDILAGMDSYAPPTPPDPGTPQPPVG